jgi:transcriptional regulator with XRE-family HTH domain
MNIRRLIGLRIKLARIKLGMTQDDLAQKLGKAKSVISSYEIGKRTIKVTDLPWLAEVLKVPITYFFEEPSRDEIIDTVTTKNRDIALTLLDIFLGEPRLEGAPNRHREYEVQEMLSTTSEVIAQMPSSTLGQMGTNSTTSGVIAQMPSSTLGQMGTNSIGIAEKSQFEHLKARIASILDGVVDADLELGRRKQTLAQLEKQITRALDEELMPAKPR